MLIYKHLNWQEYHQGDVPPSPEQDMPSLALIQVINKYIYEHNR